MHTVRRTYLPAAGRDWALPFYDPLVKLLGADAKRRILLEQAELRAGYRVLDIGCGTGSLVTLIKRVYPNVSVVGLDPDPKALARAVTKARRARASIQFDRGFSDDLPYADASFDRVFSSFMFHHLGEQDKEKTLREIRRVLKPGGSLHLLDFKGAELDDKGWLTRWIHSRHQLRDNSADRILNAHEQRRVGRSADSRGGRSLLWTAVSCLLPGVLPNRSPVSVNQHLDALLDRTRLSVSPHSVVPPGWGRQAIKMRHQLDECPARRTGIECPPASSMGVRDFRSKAG